MFRTINYTVLIEISTVASCRNEIRVRLKNPALKIKRSDHNSELYEKKKKDVCGLKGGDVTDRVAYQT